MYINLISLAVLVSVVQRGPAPAEHEVAEREAQHGGQAQPHVVRHEHQHQQVRHGGLRAVQRRLQRVPARPAHTTGLSTLHRIKHESCGGIWEFGV